ncbi:MAG: MOSC domain-containing protein, partial [Cyanobacteria bacterium J06648_11]
TVSLGVRGNSEPQIFHLDTERSRLEGWLSNFFQQPARLICNPDMGFPDDRKRPGPTLIAERTLSAVAEWYSALDTDRIRQRFRANLEVADVSAFWEDRLVDPNDRPIPFRVGDVVFEGLNPCERCVVPTRDPATGAAYSQFQRIFTERRRTTAPEWAKSNRFKHLYRLTTNTQLSPKNLGSTIRCQDEIALL